MENIMDLRKKTKLDELHLIESLSKELVFDKKEMQRILNIFKEYAEDSCFLSEFEFSEVLHNLLGFTDSFFIQRIFLAADTEKDNKIGLEEFIRILHIMLYGRIDDKIKLCFTCYDLDGDLEVVRENVTSLILEAVSDPPTRDCTADALQDLVEMIFLKLDKDKDGVISYEEFKKACHEDNIWIEAFGQCLPDHQHRSGFLVLLESNQEEE
ncbi:hypothetical protein JTE90_012704 [Oedothorax gibbosus]|uniref:EF-hand domain-containing protein n=1 Tax=Oedothorax gibbosus TaxID=931172 RepID=A0AAV6VYC0_9ARAC|nr:hypothetical protein JTE90_012704 [Oedothorax gibbosus]